MVFQRDSKYVIGGNDREMAFGRKGFPLPENNGFDPR